MTENGFAKLNLYLDVTGKREDGYHDIVSYMVSCSLHDEITIEQTSTASIEITSNDPNMPKGEKNLCYKTALAFFRKLNLLNGGIHIHIEQKIPTGTGLGSASTDAAATLRCLNQIYGNPLDSLEMFNIAKELSADMPYCLTGGYKIATGIGERLEEGPKISKVSVIIAKPENKSFSTKDMYEMIDHLETRKQHCTLNQFIGCLQQLPMQEWKDIVYNVFEECIPIESEIWNIKELLSDADCCILTGSGCGVIALVADERKAEHLYQEISKKYLSFLCKIM